MALGRDDIERDLYAVLGVPTSATPAEIKKAYRQLARELHPDKNPEDAKAEARFKEVGRAYEVLADPDARQEYDDARAAFSSGGSRGGFPGGGYAGGGGGGGVPFDLSDLFSRSGNGARSAGGMGDMFGGLFGGGRAATRPPQRGADVSAVVTVGFAEAMAGVEASVRLPGGAACDTCGGTGARPGTTPHACPVCGGAGLVNSQQGGFAFSEPCRNCHGTGSVVDDPCPTCDGTGRRERTVKIRIPAGVADGQRLRVRGRGEPGQRGGPAGDLDVTVSVARHRVFGRTGADLTVTVPVTFPEAALGATVTVPTLGEPVTLKVPAGSTSGRRLRVRGRGFPHGKPATAGDLIVTVEVAVPAKLSAPAREALAAYADAAPDDPRGDLLSRAAAG